MNYSSTEAERFAAAEWLDEIVPLTRRVQEHIRRTHPSGVLTIDPLRVQNAAPRLVGLHQAIATDHLVSFAGLLRAPGSHGPSLASIDRSFVETWARAWWVMGAPTSTHAEYRARAMVVAELSAAARRGIRLLSMEPIDLAIARATSVRDEIKTRVPEAVPSFTTLAREMLQEAGLPIGESAAVYSHLSGVAHGESVFTASFAAEPIAFPSPGIALPADNLKKYLTTLFSVTLVATSRLADAWGLPDEIGSEFVSAATEVGRRLPAHLAGSDE